MRKACSDFSIIKDETTFYGISLGYDYCAEHEWGIEKMKDDLGIGKPKRTGLLGIFEKTELGIKSRTITKHDSVIFKTEGNKAVLTNHLPWRKSKEDVTLNDLIARDLTYSTSPPSVKNELYTAWDEEHFCILVSGEENIKFLEELYNNFLMNNIAIARVNSSLPAFSNASLCILIADSLPKESVDAMYNADKSAQDLVDYEEKIGLTKLKKETRNGYKKEKYYCACSPKWINYENAEAREEYKSKVGTKYDIQYWINYSDDDDNYGYYTVEEIKKWLSTPGLKLTQIRKATEEKLIDKTKA